MSSIKVIDKHKPKHAMRKAIMRSGIQTRKRIAHFSMSFSYPFGSFLVLFDFCAGTEWRPCVCQSRAILMSIPPANFLLFILRHSLLSCAVRLELTMELAILLPQTPEQAGLQACSTRPIFSVLIRTVTSH